MKGRYLASVLALLLGAALTAPVDASITDDSDPISISQPTFGPDSVSVVATNGTSTQASATIAVEVSGQVVAMGQVTLGGGASRTIVFSINDALDPIETVIYIVT